MGRPAGAITESGVIAAAEVLRCALHDAVAGTGGLGGLLHLRDGPASRELHLASSAGLPSAFTEKWQHLPLDASAAPAAAARLDRPVWYPAPGGPGAGLASVPLPSLHGEVAGALTVVMPAGEPAAGQWDSLVATGKWAAELLRHAGSPDGSMQVPLPRRRQREIQPGRMRPVPQGPAPGCGMSNRAC